MSLPQETKTCDVLQKVNENKSKLPCKDRDIKQVKLQQINAGTSKSKGKTWMTYNPHPFPLLNEIFLVCPTSCFWFVHQAAFAEALELHFLS